MYAVFGDVWINDYGRALAFTSIVLFVSAISYLLVELPAMTWLRNYLVRIVARPGERKVP